MGGKVSVLGFQEKVRKEGNRWKIKGVHLEKQGVCNGGGRDGLFFIQKECLIF